MGCGAVVEVVGLSGWANRVVARVAELEDRWSRFLPDSELNLVNRAAGSGAVVISADTFGLIERCLLAWRRTGGLFDPTVAAALVHAGYDRTFGELRGGTHGAPGTSDPVRGCRGIVLDGRHRTVDVPAGVALDPGGIGKGLAADIVVAELAEAGAHGAMVSLGGDVRVWGAPPEGRFWTVEVEHPAEPVALGSIRLCDGAVTTSSVSYRRWDGPDGPRHHVIDPRTASPARTDLVQASVAAGRGWWAEALSTAALVAGSAAAIALLSEWRAPAVLRCVSGRTILHGDQFTRAVEVLP